MEEDIFMTKEEKLLRKAIDTQSFDEIKKVLAQSDRPISKKLVVPVLRSLIGRFNFDFSVVDLLKKRQCDLNPTLDSEYRLGDYLAYFGRLSPRLVTEMGKAGYSFSDKNDRGEHAGFYLIASIPLNKKVIASLKAQGIDFKEKNKEGKTAVDVMISVISQYTTQNEQPGLASLRINRFSGLIETAEELRLLSLKKTIELKEFIQNKIDEIKPQSYENIGINDLYNEIKDCSVKIKKLKSNTAPNVENKQHFREGA